jgi:hypothetical protein
MSYRQGVDVRAQGEGATGPTSHQAGDDAVLGGARDLQPPEGFERLADETGRLLLVEGDLGFAVEVAPPLE